MKQLFFIILLLATLSLFAYTIRRLYFFFKLTKPFPIKDFSKRFQLVLEVAIGQTKILRQLVIGFIHALVFWGFIVILFGSIEMVIDGLFGTERALAALGGFYNVIMALGDVFAFIILVAIIIFLIRRTFLHIKRFEGIEMKHKSHVDAAIALTFILLLMVSLLGLNTFYSAAHTADLKGLYPVSSILAPMFSGLSHSTLIFFEEFFWWMHITLIFAFANVLPYSKHFHVFMSVPNVFLSRLEPLGKLNTMESVTKEVKIMLDPNLAYAEPPAGEQAAPERFGVKDVTDATWKNYVDSLTCTQCGRCTAACPANTTGKKLSPRKIFVDFRERMNEKGNGILKNGKDYDDGKSYIRDYISEEEIWACTTCNACAAECPVNINHPSLIVDMRRYLVMEEGSAPTQIKSMLTNIENNGAPWQFSAEDRLLWTNDLTLNVNGESKPIEIPTMAEVVASGKQPEYLFWVGCAGAIDDRYKKVTRAFAKLLTHCNVNYAILGAEESCTGDSARRAGNEMLFQMQAMTNISILNGYEVKKIITMCPHCFNSLKNEYPDLDGHYELIHHSEFINQLIAAGKLKVDANKLNDKSITYHDPCYLGRANNEYNSARNVINSVSGNLTEMKRNKSFSLCCGAGGSQMFKEAEKGDKEVFMERINDAIETNANVVATSCPFCMTMMTDGIKYNNKEESMKNYDIAELVVMALGI